MPIPFIALWCAKEGCNGTVYYDRTAAAFQPCGRCGKAPKDANEWFTQALSVDLDLSKFPHGCFSIAWLTANKLGWTEAEEQEQFDSLTDADHKLLGDYTDALNRGGTAAYDFLDSLPVPPSPAVERLMRTARLLHLAASAGR